jgi:pimeloyl-ACP methyl ester carboxylesterase
LQTEWVGLISWVAAALVIAPIVIAGAGGLLQCVGLRRDARRYPPAGLLLTRGDRDLHVVQRGDGQPAVIFEAGLAASSLSWARVQPLVASFASSVSYDRAGLGWSSPRTSPPFLEEMLEDLRSVVVWAGSGEPVVLVAHSFGALLLLAFAQQYPNLVAGLVLVDPVSLATWSDCSTVDRHRLQVGAQLSRRGAWLAKFGVVRAALKILLRGGQPFARLIGRRAAGRAATTLERLTGEVSKLPMELWPVVAAHWSRPHNFRAMADTLEALPAYAAEVSSPQLPAELPVAILSAASATEGELRERNGWLMGLRNLEHKRLQETGHWLHLERPEEVAAAVQWCVERSQLHA